MAGETRSHLIMLGLIAAACALLSNGEHILINGGLGFDGRIYGAMVRNPALALEDSYYFHRALPSWIVGAGLRASGVPSVDEHIIGGFLVLNSILLLTSAAFWCAIGARLQLSPPARWLGFVGLFCNFPMLKMPFYYPVSTDPAAFALGMTIAFAAVTERGWLIAVAILAGTVTWPAGTLFAAPLLLWPRGTQAPHDARPTSLGTAVALTAAGLFVGWFFWIYVVRGQTVRASHHSVGPIGGVVWIGIAGAVAYIFVAARALMGGVTPPYLIGAVRTIAPSRVLLLIGALLPATLVVMMFVEDRPGLTARAFIGNVVFFSSTRPFLFVVGNLVYFGPILLLLLSPRIRNGFMEAVRMLGPGWLALTIAALGLSLNSEARQSVLQYPAIVVLLSMAASRTGLSGRATWCIAIICFAFSKVWLPINAEPSAMLDPVDAFVPLVYRRYFDNHGPWMSNEAYLVNALAIAVSGALIWVLVRAEPTVTSPGPVVRSATGDPARVVRPG